MATSVASFKIGIAAFIVPFMFFYNNAILMEGGWFEVTRAAITALAGIFLLSSGVQGWFAGGRTAWFLRLGLIISSVLLIKGGWLTDGLGIAGATAIYFIQKVLRPDANASVAVRGAD